MTAWLFIGKQMKDLCPIGMQQVIVWTFEMVIG